MRLIICISFLASLITTGMAVVHPVFESSPLVLRTGSDATVSDRLDGIVLKRLAELNLKPANLCSDAVFVRRAVSLNAGFR